MRRYLLITFKLSFAVLSLAAIITEIVTITGRGTFNPANFLSYFTIQSNILLVVSLLVSLLLLLRGRSSPKLDVFRSAVTVYILVVGIGFAVLLSGLEDVTFTAVPLDNLILHYIMPIIGLLDLLVDRPHTRTSFTRSLLWLIYPLVYVVYSLLRGAVTGWYPYPFLNPTIDGFGRLVVPVVGLLVLGFLFIQIIRLIQGRRENAHHNLRRRGV